MSRGSLPDCQLQTWDFVVAEEDTVPVEKGSCESWDGVGVEGRERGHYDGNVKMSSNDGSGWSWSDVSGGDGGAGAGACGGAGRNVTSDAYAVYVWSGNGMKARNVELHWNDQ